jgi:hypothetical protein
MLLIFSLLLTAFFLLRRLLLRARIALSKKRAGVASFEATTARPKSAGYKHPAILLLFNGRPISFLYSYCARFYQK